MAGVEAARNWAVTFAPNGTLQRMMSHNKPSRLDMALNDSECGTKENATPQRDAEAHGGSFVSGRANGLRCGDG